MTTQLSSIEINPLTDAVGSVIWLHGLGADGNDFVPIVQELHSLNALPLRFIFPHAPMMAVTINNGYVMRAWYDIISFSVEAHADTAGIEKTTQQISQLIEQEENRGVATEKIILGGFSQGGVIALTTGLLYPKQLGGIISLSSYLPEANTILNRASPLNKTTPIFLGHGVDDPIVPYYLSENTFLFLQKNQYGVESHSYPMPHTVCSEEVRDIAIFLKKIYSQRSS